MSSARVFFVDSSVVRGQERSFFKLTSTVEQLQARGCEIRITVFAVVYTEMVFAYRRGARVSFDGTMISENLKDRGVEVVTLDQVTGGASLRCWQAGSRAENWDVAKKTSGNLDWHIAAHAMSVEGATLLVHDKGVEFSKVERKSSPQGPARTATSGAQANPTLSAASASSQSEEL